jgi:hypothetical protein
MNAPKTRNKSEGPTGPEAAHARRGLRQRLRTWQAAVLAVGAVAGSVIVVWNLWDRLFPPDEPPLAPRSASFTQVDLDQKNASQHEYCRDELDGDALADCLDGAEGVGNVFSVGIKLTGYEGVCCSLKWTLENVKTREVVNEFVAVPDIEPKDALGDRRIFPIFVPNPAQAGDYVVHFVLADSDGEIENKDSQLFQVR